MSRKGTIRRCGHVWKSSETYYKNDWHTTVDDRFHPMTWKFGDIHQAKVMVDYDHMVEGKKIQSIKFGGTVDFGLQYGKTMEEAMTTCLNWIKEFQENGPPSVEQLFQDCWDNWPMLYPAGNRIAVINSIFFTIGCSYDWLDGAIVCTTPHDYIEARKRDEKDDSLKKVLEAAKEIRNLLKERKAEKNEEPEDDWDDVKKKYWEMDTYQFYPVSETYSNICMVPDDVRPEWLKLAYEAAQLLRDKSGVLQIKSRWYRSEEHDYARQEQNRQLGAKIVADLERRFPNVTKEG